jgi:hypothetical protein
MARAYGSSAHLLMKRESTYGHGATGNDRQRAEFSDLGYLPARRSP